MRPRIQYVQALPRKIHPRSHIGGVRAIHSTCLRGSNPKAMRRLLQWAQRTQSVGQDRAIDEETLPNYEVEEFYPVHIGEIFHQKYQVLGKLGFGANSTVWLCRDLHAHRYVTLKVYVRTPPSYTQMHRELQVYQHLKTIRSSHSGQRFIRHVLDSFEVVQPDGTQHHCLVHAPLHMTLWDIQRLGRKPTGLPEDMVRGALRYLFQPLDFLHTEANITHCDIKAGNLMLTVEDDSILADFEKAELEDPCPRKVINNTRTIYASRNFRRPKNHAWGHPILCDVGEARIGSSHAHEEIQPEIYKAPEIIMQTGWSQSIDIWNTACMVWDIFENKHLFDARDGDGEHSNRFHVAEMVAYLGNPPIEFQRRSERTPLVFDEAGHWKGDPPLPQLSLEDSEEKLEGANKVAFLNFMRSMLTWLPEERKTAKELLDDPWLSGQI